MEPGRMNQLLDDIRRDVDQIESPVSQALSNEYVVRLALTLAENVRLLHVTIIDRGELPDEWEASVQKRIVDDDEEV